MRTRQQVQACLDVLKVRAGLTNWTIQVANEPAGDEVWAEVDVQDYNHANLHLGQSFWQMETLQEQVACLYHELMHCHTRRLYYTTESMMEALAELVPPNRRDLHKRLAGVLMRLWEQREEEIVEAVAQALAKGHTYNEKTNR